MSYGEVGADGIWTIPAERYKTKRPNFVPLSNVALALIKCQQKLEDCQYVFPTNAKTPYPRSGKSKAALDRGRA